MLINYWILQKCFLSEHRFQNSFTSRFLGVVHKVCSYELIGWNKSERSQTFHSCRSFCQKTLHGRFSDLNFRIWTPIWSIVSSNYETKIDNSLSYYYDTCEQPLITVITVLFTLGKGMSRIIKTFKWFGNNPKKSLVLFLLGAYGADYAREKYL